MTITPSTNLLQRIAALFAPFRNPADNPIVIKELRGRMRGRRAFIVLILYLLGISLLVGIVYNSLETNSYHQDLEFRQNAGKAIFGSVLGFELIMIGFIGPALTAGAITSERERQTFDLLRTTLISPRTLVLGKLASACTYLLLLTYTALPIQALAFLIGGIGMEEIIVSILMLLVNIFFFCALGFLCSTFSKRTLTATITCYSIILVSILLSGLIIYGFVINMSIPSYGPNSASATLAGVGLWLFCSTNSLLTGIVSEMFLVQNHVFYYGQSPINNMYLFSPWVLHVLFYALFAMILVLISIIRLSKTDR